ncbi:hypothetical protein DKG77_13535 [Flagellimonas aquimarina]|uniref:Uncharacterized protein n=1 Tax=Flagellimonas aquimarina TaxID=2201895 RepID=A0A316KW74_9FLAO|nr:hypothetical protein [Allomuricauda koreensis]PWL37791.1 hypothetical protein DKG77_13535 [Allomuricauda koreensis]
MDGKKITQRKIDEVLDSASQMEAVNAPPFFKDKVLQRLTSNNQVIETSNLLGWFLPKYQIAALVVFAFLNFGALYVYNNSNQEDEIKTFAQAYGLAADEDNSILN